MTEEELRQIVRDAIARHLGAPPLAPPAAGASAPGPAPQLHPSHVRFPLASGAETDGPCLVEPSVSCVHCGYCQSYGH